MTTIKFEDDFYEDVFIENIGYKQKWYRHEKIGVICKIQKAEIFYTEEDLEEAYRKGYSDAKELKYG